MRMKEKIKLLRGISYSKFIYYNFMCPQVVRHGKNYIIPYRHAVIQLHKSAQIELNDHFYINYERMKGSNAEAYLKMLENTKLVINGTSELTYHSTIEVHKNGELILGGAYINRGSVIICAKRIEIGNNVLIARNTYIYDSDHHKVYSEEGTLSIQAKEIEIGDNVWVGLNSMILKGAKIGNGAVVGAGSIVMSRVKASTFVMGNPARAYMQVKWEV